MPHHTRPSRRTLLSTALGGITPLGMVPWLGVSVVAAKFRLA